MKNNWIVLKQIDRQLGFLKGATVPKQGWVRTIRKGLGFTIKQLAKKLNVDPSRVVKIEMAEPDGAITLHTLQTVAHSLDCQLVYAFVPNTSLENRVKKQARAIALRQLQRTAHTMDLEAQSVTKQWLDDQVDELAQELLQRSWKHLWEEE